MSAARASGSALCAAAEVSDVAEVARLLDAGADINAVNEVRPGYPTLYGALQQP